MRRARACRAATKLNQTARTNYSNTFILIFINMFGTCLFVDFQFCNDRFLHSSRLSCLCDVMPHSNEINLSQKPCYNRNRFACVRRQLRLMLRLWHSAVRVFNLNSIFMPRTPNPRQSYGTALFSLNI